MTAKPPAAAETPLNPTREQATPLTDKEEGSNHDYWGWDYQVGGGFVHADFARAIERQLSEAQARLREAEKDADIGCICKGNWRLIVSEYRHLFGRKYVEDRTGDEYTFYGLVISDDDYYYGMYRKGECRLLSCVGSIEGFGFTLIDAALKEQS